MPYEELTRKHLNNLKQRIEQMMQTKGLNASGSTVDSLEIRDNKLLGDEAFYYLDKGRGPGKFPPATRS